VKLHAFLATAADLPRALREGTDGFSGTLLSGADPANLSSLFELVTHGELPADEALADLEQPVASAGPDGPWIHVVPAPAMASLAAASSAETPDQGLRLDWTAPADGIYRLRLRDLRLGTGAASVAEGQVRSHRRGRR